MSRSDARSDSLRHRPPRIVPATITAVVLLALGVGLVWIAVLKLAQGSWPGFLGAVNGWASALTWGSALAWAITIAVAILGLILVIAAIKPGTPNAVLLHEPTGDGTDGTTEYVMTRRSVAKLATAHASQIDGVDGVSATAMSRRVTLAVKTPSEQTDQISQSVTRCVTDALTAAGLQPVPRVTARVRTTKV